MSSHGGAALFHHPDAVDTSRPQLMGRHAAGEGFLRGYVRHGSDEVLYCHAASRPSFEDFSIRVGRLDARNRARKWIPLDRSQGLAEPGCLYMPGPGLADFAWRRRSVASGRDWSLCGVTHTTASEGVMDVIGSWLTAPLQPWDAVICTSRAVRTSVSHVLDGYADYLSERTGGRVRPLLQLPIVPLGVECEAYADGAPAQFARKTFRDRFGIADEDVALLFVGRLSFHAKAHPLPFYLAAEETVRRTGRRVHLIQAGWFAHPKIEEQFREGAKAFCPSVNAVFADGREDGVRKGIWFAGDIFVSLSDNIQETFGLTPIEAMAAGLPVVATDWNGYRDTVRPGVDGFLVPTAMPAAGHGEDIRLFTGRELGAKEQDHAYNVYCGVASQSTAVDIGATTEALVRLAGDPALRRRMGEAGRRRAAEVYDWRVVIAAYETLWAELAEIRSHGAESAPRKPGTAGHPLRDDPFRTFACYPSFALGDDTRVSPLPGMGIADVRRLGSHSMNRVDARHLLGEQAIARVLECLTRLGETSAGSLRPEAPENNQSAFWRTLAWLAKLGVIALVPAARTPAVDPAAEALRRARIAQARGQLGEAGRIIRAALVGQPDHPRLNALAGEFLLAQRRPDLAVGFLRRSVRADPTDLTAQLELGTALTLSGDGDGGIAAFRRCVRMAPSHVAANMRLGAALWRAGRPEEAEPHVRQGISLGFRDPAGSHQLAMIRRARGDDVGARDALARAHAADPGDLFVQAALDTLDSPNAGDGAPRVALHMNVPRQYGLLKPLFDGLKGAAALLFSADTRELADFDPDSVIVCDEPAPALRTAAPRAVYLRHTPDDDAGDTLERVLAAVASGRNRRGA